jgi:hypothetical protein
MKLRTTLAAALGAALLALSGATAQPAGAAAGDTYVKQGKGKEACPSEHLCLYAEFHWNTDSNHRLLVTDTPLHQLSNPDYNFNDTTSSVYNNTSQCVRLYPNYDYVGVPLTVFPGEAFDFTDDNGRESGWYDNRYSSVQFVQCPGHSSGGMGS